MKSAYELAMERKGVMPLTELNQEQKEKIAEIESLYKSKRVAAELSAHDKKQKAFGHHELINQIIDDLAVELASINSVMKREKEAVRNEAK